MQLLPHRKIASKLASISKLSEFCIIIADNNRGTVTVRFDPELLATLAREGINLSLNLKHNMERESWRD